MPEIEPVQRFRLDGRVVLVTGAAGLLGRPIARAVAAAGGTPVLAGRSPATLEPLADDIRANGASCHVLAFDVGDADACRAAIGRLAREVDALHGIVNGAYGGRPGTIASALSSTTL